MKGTKNSLKPVLHAKRLKAVQKPQRTVFYLIYEKNKSLRSNWFDSEQLAQHKRTQSG